MATHSEIHYYTGEELQTVYCHFDGYLEGVGETLFKNYQDPNKAKELVALGDLSYIGGEVNPTDEEHSFGTPQDGVTVAYHRDRGEELRVRKLKKKLNNTADILRFTYDNTKEGYSYLYNQRDKTWYFIDIYEEDIKLLSKALGKKEPVKDSGTNIPKNPNVYLTRKKSVEIARTLRLNQGSYYGIIRGLGGKPTDLYFREEALGGVKDVVFQANWEDFQEKIGKRPTQAELADYIYRKGNHEVFRGLTRGRLSLWY